MTEGVGRADRCALESQLVTLGNLLVKASLCELGNLSTKVDEIFSSFIVGIQ